MRTTEDILYLYQQRMARLDPLHKAALDVRAAYTMPDLYYPSRQPGKSTYDQRARQRTLVNRAWWDRDRMKLKLRKRARHMVYYAGSPVMLRPHFDDKRPT